MAGAWERWLGVGFCREGAVGGEVVDFMNLFGFPRLLKIDEMS